tara:strand:+ start:252 stop:755 length:504 start_codon:yes stop_codon:yes gene_type:complete
MNSIDIFTDGSTLNNQVKGKRKGGIGVFFGDDDPKNISLSLEESDDNKVTNQVAELSACIKAIEKLLSEQLIENNKIVIYTDSMYIVNMINLWADKWKQNDWIKSDGNEVLNLDLVKKLYYYSKNLSIEYKHVKSHKKEPQKDDPKHYLWYGNMQADRLAVDAASKI